MSSTIYSKVVIIPDDDWETDASYDNRLTENEQRWGKEAAGQRAGAIE